MKKSNQAAWCRTTGWAAAVALAATFAVAPSIARAACVGDCNGDGEVTVNELISMVNIALGSADISTCMNGDADGNGEITVNEIVTGVNNALNGCPPPPTPTPGTGACGNGSTETGEECDPGSICIGGTNAGTVCTKEADCIGEGICDTFGTKGPAGTVVRKVCSADSECGGAKCIHCKPFGGKGCAVNCTTEAETVVNLVTGLFNGNEIVPGTSGAVVHGDLLTIPLPLQGTNRLLGGKLRNGLIPIAQHTDGTSLARIPVSNLACACVRGSEYKTCGGTQFEADGQTVSISCTADATLCDGKKPCTAVAGPGNAGEGVIGCDGLPSASYTVVQDAGGETGTVGPAIFTARQQCTGGSNANKVCTTDADCPDGTCGGGGPGSQVLATGSAIGTVVGVCTGTSADYGPDGEFCTDDDPHAPAPLRGIPSIQTLVSGTASAQVLGASDIDGNDIGPFSYSGHTVSCENISSGNTTGAAQAGAFTSLDQPTLSDIAVTDLFVSQ